jgi:hypothetical protein
MKKILFALLFLSPLCFGGVWENKNSWSDPNTDWEGLYSEWIKSSEVKVDLFTNEKSIYYGLAADCADLIYFLRIIFSHKNSLDYKVRDPNRRGQYFSNNTSKWDGIQDPMQRLRKFLEFIKEFHGTESLAKLDSYPIAAADIRPGDIFMYKLVPENFDDLTDDEKETSTTRHSYMIKNVTSIGLFDVILSTQDIRDEGTSLKYYRNFQFSPSKVTNIVNWGFKRIKKPSHYSIATSEIKGVSFEQYDLMAKLGNEGFLDYVQEGLSQRKETPDSKLQRLMDSVCEKVQDRITTVDSALAYTQKTGNQCMNYGDYDKFSTPSRDGEILSVYNSLQGYLKLIDLKGLTVDSMKLFTAQSIFKEKLSYLEESLLYKYCLIKIRPLFELNLAAFFKSLENGTVSSHPNDDLYSRWGEPTLERTDCHRWY